MATYDKGDLVRCIGTFTDAASVAIDPTSVFFQFKNPAGTITPYEYGVDVELVKDSTGVYHVDVDVSTHGIWMYRFYSTGTGQAADERSFRVSDSQFD